MKRQANSHQTMKAWVLKKDAPVESRPLSLTEVPTPFPLPDEILVQVTACGICRTDLHVAEGQLALRLQNGQLDAKSIFARHIMLPPNRTPAFRLKIMHVFTSYVPFRRQAIVRLFSLFARRQLL